MSLFSHDKHEKPAPKPEPTPAEKQLQRVDARIATVTKAIIEQMYADTLAEALAVADKFRNETHLITLSDERAELAFLNRRREQLAGK